MAEMLDVSWALYEAYPDLNPDPADPRGGTGGQGYPDKKS